MFIMDTARQLARCNQAGQGLVGPAGADFRTVFDESLRNLTAGDIPATAIINTPDDRRLMLSSVPIGEGGSFRRPKVARARWMYLSSRMPVLIL